MNRTQNGKPRIYVNAMLCDRVIKDSNGFLTAITIMSGYSVSPLKIALASPDGAIDEAHPKFVWQPLRVNLVITFVTEESAEFETMVKIVGPRGREMDDSNTHRFPVKIGGGAEGHTISMSVRIAVPLIGEYWFEIYVDGDLATKTPMRIVYARSSLENLEALPAMEHSLLEPEGRP
jgi:hypothetical protein